MHAPTPTTEEEIGWSVTTKSDLGAVEQPATNSASKTDRVKILIVSSSHRSAFRAPIRQDHDTAAQQQGENSQHIKQALFHPIILSLRNFVALSFNRSTA